MVSKRASSGTPASTPSKMVSSASSSQSHTTSSMKSQSYSTSFSTSATTTTNTSTGTTASQKSRAQMKKDIWNPPADSTELVDIFINGLKRYRNTTPQRVLIIDAFMGFLVALGLTQFLYCVVAGNYPFNAFLSGFSATVGQFVLTASLRIQTNPENKKGNFEAISDERAFADFILGSLILHLFCVNFIN